MVFTCQQADLLAAVQMAGRAVATKSPMAILEGILMRAEDSRITLIATDTHFGISAELEADVTEPGSVVLPGRLITEVVRKMPEGVMTVRADERNAAVLRCLDSRTTIQGLPAREFPALPEVEDAQRVTLPQKTLRDMIRQTAFAMSTDESRQILTGSLFEVTTDRLKLVALDGFRLGLRQTAVEATGEFSAVVPGKPLIELSRILGDDDRPIDLHFSPSHMHVQIGNTQVIMRLLEGQYIQYDRIIPVDHQLRVRMDRRAFEDSVDRASLMAREGRNNLVHLHIGKERMTMRSNNEQGEVYEEIPVLTEGSDLDIAFNVRFLNDLCKSIDDDEMVLQFISNLTPCVIRPVSGDEYVYLLLPVRIAGGG